MPNVFKKIIFAALIFLMFVPLLQQVTGYFYESELKGAYVKPEKPRFSLSKITLFFMFMFYLFICMFFIFI